MQWHELYPASRQPSMEEISDYIGGNAKELWLSLLNYMEVNYNVKPKLFYSCCSGKPGWNVKLQKSGQSFGTLYPEENSFSVMLIISYRLDPFMQLILPELSPATAGLYNNAGDYMQMGRWMMLKINDSTTLEDYKKIITAKLPHTK